MEENNAFEEYSADKIRLEDNRRKLKYLFVVFFISFVVGPFLMICNIISSGTLDFLISALVFLMAYFGANLTFVLSKNLILAILAGLLIFLLSGVFYGLGTIGIVCGLLYKSKTKIKSFEV